MAAKVTDSCLVKVLSSHMELDEEQLELVATLEKEERSYPAETRIQSRGDVLQNLYVVKSGWLYLSTDLADGRRHILRTHHAGDVIGLSDLAYSVVTANLTSSNDVVLCPFPKSALESIFVRSPRLAALLLTLSARDQVVYIDLLRATARLSARDRVMFLLLTFLYRLRVALGPDVDSYDLPLNQTQLGDLLGLTNVSVSKAMVELEQGGWIRRTRHRITMLDIDALARRIEFTDRHGALDTSWFPSGSGRC